MWYPYVFFSQHLRGARDLVLWSCHIVRLPDNVTSGLLTNNEGNHGCSISAGGFKTLNKLLDLPHLNVRIVLCIWVRHDGQCRGEDQCGVVRVML